MVERENENNANTIWQYLKNNGGCSAKDLKEKLKMNYKEFYMALNQLTRDNKIVFYAENKNSIPK